MQVQALANCWCLHCRASLVGLHPQFCKAAPAGMACAWSLSRFPERFEVEVWETLPETGGVASTCAIDGGACTAPCSKGCLGVSVKHLKLSHVATVWHAVLPCPLLASLHCAMTMRLQARRSMTRCRAGHPPTATTCCSSRCGHAAAVLGVHAGGTDPMPALHSISPA